MRTEVSLLAAALAPIASSWVPLWDKSIFREGWAGAVAFCIAAAVLEEAIFRGMIQGWLMQSSGLRRISFAFSRANWLTSLLFALAHLWQHSYRLFPGYFAVSLALGYFRERYCGILAPLALHAWFNLTLLLHQGLREAAK